MRAQPPSTRCGGRTDLGWGHDLEGAFAAHRAHGLRPARVAIEHRGAYTILEPGPGGPCEGLAAVSGRFRYGTTRPADYPAVGDWVAIDGDTSANSATIHAVLPRRTAFSRLAAGLRTEAQVVAANVDVVFVAMGLDGDFNLRRLERYLAVAWGSGARPVVLLTKADACPDVEGMRIAASATAPGVEVLAVSAVSGQGLGVVAARVGLGTTAAVLGSSGVGKSTLINALLGRSVLATAAVRDDDRGRHTTTSRQLIVLPSCGMIIDTPGMRELGLWQGGEAIDEAFAEIDELAASCRFADCLHEHEPGCAVLVAIGEGRLPRERLKNRRKMEREAARTEGRRSPAERAEARRFAKMVRNISAETIARKSAESWR